jgi:hypothetical protein
LTQLSARTGQPVSTLVREAVTQFLAAALAQQPPAPSAPRVPVQSFAKPAAQPSTSNSTETTVRVQHPSAVEVEPDVVILAQTSASQDDLPKVIVDEQPMVIAGPGALRAAGVEPLELTNPKPPRETPPDESVSRWFKQ